MPPVDAPARAIGAWTRHASQRTNGGGEARPTAESGRKAVESGSPAGPGQQNSPAISTSGRVAEWFKAPVLKTGRGFRSLVGSNPTPTAILAIRIADAAAPTATEKRRGARCLPANAASARNLRSVSPFPSSGPPKRRPSGSHRGATRETEERPHPGPRQNLCGGGG